jgi:hypothetical protein
MLAAPIIKISCQSHPHPHPRVEILWIRTLSAKLGRPIRMNDTWTKTFVRPPAEPFFRSLIAATNGFAFFLASVLSFV